MGLFLSIPTVGPLRALSYDDVVLATEDRDHGSAHRPRYQDSRGAGMEGRACTALLGVIVLAEASHLSQPEGHPVGIASRRPARQRELHPLVSGNQSTRPRPCSGA